MRVLAFVPPLLDEPINKEKKGWLDNYLIVVIYQEPKAGRKLVCVLRPTRETFWQGFCAINCDVQEVFCHHFSGDTLVSLSC